MTPPRENLPPRPRAGPPPGYPQRPPVNRYPPPPPPRRPRRPPPPAPGGDPARAGRSLVRSSKTLAIASLISRLTGFVRTAVIAAAIGATGTVADAYNTANTLPNIIYELLLGGVLTSVIVPLLVHAQERDRDGGQAYAQRLLSLMTAVLLVATVLVMLAAPILTWLYNIRDDSGQVTLANTWARLLLPEIVFYGLGAMLSAVLNARGVFAAPAWAPVLNNVVVIATAIVFIALPGPARLNPATITHDQVWTLGVGTTLGIVIQALILVPALRQARFRWRWRWDWRGTGLGEVAHLFWWVLGYVAVSQVWVSVSTALANHTGREAGIGSNVYAIASLLFQTPYGILGVALLTVLMPRLSRSAARRDLVSLKTDLSLGTRLTVVALVPTSALMFVLADPIASVFLEHGQTNSSGADAVSRALAASVLGMVPFAVTMLQIRVFYAVKDAKTPTVINMAMVIARLVMCIPAAIFAPARDLVMWLALINGLSFYLGAFMGTAMLRHRFGPLGLTRQFRVLVRISVASLVGMPVAAFIAGRVTDGVGHGFAGSLLALVLAAILGGGIIVGLARLMRVRELNELMGTVRGRLDN